MVCAAKMLGHYKIGIDQRGQRGVALFDTDTLETSNGCLHFKSEKFHVLTCLSISKYVAAVVLLPMAAKLRQQHTYTPFSASQPRMRSATSCQPSSSIMS